MSSSFASLLHFVLQQQPIAMNSKNTVTYNSSIRAFTDSKAKALTDQLHAATNYNKQLANGFKVRA